MRILQFLLSTALIFTLIGPAQAADELPIPGYAASRDYPGSQLQPDPNTEYKVLFDLVVTDNDLDDPYPLLPLIARYVNTLAHLGVAKENRKIAVVMHQGSGLIGLKNEEFRARNNGKDNPNIELIQQLHAAGVTFHLCGQGVLSREIAEADLLDEIQIDYWALTTLIELGRQGYVKIGG